MLKNVKTLEDLIGKAIKIKDKERRIVFWPQYEWHTVEEYLLSNDYCIHEHTYNINNAVIAFYENEVMYVIPYFHEGIAILEAEGFHKNDMFVPYSNREYPIVEHAHWKRMIEESKELLVEAYRRECVELSEKMGILPIDQELLDEKCMVIPDEGIMINNPNKEPKRKFPVIVGYLCDNITFDNLGRYYVNKNNGIITFVNADGIQYVTKSDKVHKQLFERGYKFKKMEEIFGDDDKPADDEVIFNYNKLTIA